MTDPVITSMQPTSPTLQKNSLTLSESINISTRSAHSQLNRLIIERLPLALPPRYLLGLGQIAEVYFEFESSWQSILETSPSPMTLDEREFLVGAPQQSFPDLRSHSKGHNTAPSSLALASLQPGLSKRTRFILSYLHLPGLLRSSRLHSDLAELSSEKLQGFQPSQSDALQNFIASIRLSIKTNPIVLIAFAYVLYLALFSGGRILRFSLQKLNGDSAMSSLRFFSFDGNFDGEDLRVEFKNRLAKIEGLLTSEEKLDIVNEAEKIFQSIIRLVFAIDEICSAPTRGSCDTGHHESQLRPHSILLTPSNQVRDSKRQQPKTERHGINPVVQPRQSDTSMLLMRLDEQIDTQTRNLEGNFRKTGVTFRGYDWQGQRPRHVPRLMEWDGGMVITISTIIITILLWHFSC